MSGLLIGILENRGFVPVDFVSSLLGIEHPDIPVEIIFQPGPELADMRERLAFRALELDVEYVLMLDSDMVYPRSLILDLMEADVDVICGFAVTKAVPHMAVFTRPPLNNDRSFGFRPAWPTPSGNADDEALTGVQEVHVVGGAGLLIKTEVLKKIERPWFSYRGKTEEGGTAGEDCYFSKMARDAGFKLHMHTGVRVGHMTTTTVFPSYDPAAESWGVSFQRKLTQAEADRRTGLLSKADALKMTGPTEEMLTQEAELHTANSVDGDKAVIFNRMLAEMKEESDGV